MTAQTCGCVRFLVIAGICLTAAANSVSAQTPATGISPSSTRISPERVLALEVLIQPQARDRIRAQEWGRLLQEFGYSPRFRVPAVGEKQRFEEETADGRLRLLVVGGLLADGSIDFGGRRFTLSDGPALDVFLKDLRKHGPGGPAAGNPRWGLTDEQFLAFSGLLRAPVEQPLHFAGPAETVKRLGLPMELSVVFVEESLQASLQSRPETVPEQLDLAGISHGTALAIVLSQYGMGFRPVLTKQGKFVVEIQSGGEADNLWPVGWKTLEPVPDVLPAWLKSIPFSIEDADLSSVVDAVSGKLEIPAYSSAKSLAAAGRSLDELTWSRSGKLSPFAMLRTVGEKFELGFDVRADEAGRLFLWVTTRQQADAFARRFAHIRPVK
ncbi:MAG: hypothetical protein ACKO2P_15545 [Planctomycetota bacterium]